MLVQYRGKRNKGQSPVIRGTTLTMVVRLIVFLCVVCFRCVCEDPAAKDRDLWVWRPFCLRSLIVLHTTYVRTYR